MKRFWDGIIKSILDGLNPNTMLEIGVDKGENTRNILEYCAKNECKLISIDPFPDSSVSELEYNYKNEFTLLRDLSLNVLPDMENAQVFFIDGDHNWYTVYHELLCIENKKDLVFPLIFLHDIEWPYDYRDLYYNPADIPPEYRQDYAKKGVELNSVNLLEEGGFNASFNNALVSGTAKNGVFTAIIDFLNQSKYDLKFIKIKGFHGLGIIYDENLYLQNQGFKNSIDKLNDSLDCLEGYLTRLSNTFYENSNEIAILRGVKRLYNHLLREKSHLERVKSNLELDNSNLQVNKAALEKQVRFYEHSNRKKEKRIHNLVKDYNKLKTQVDDLSSALYEVNYSDNHGRSLKQRLISKFPSAYILSRRNNNFKTNLLTIKGCKSIKKNNLFDIGYYLRENRDVRKSGADPLIHYIYYGYKEGRNPSPKFDTNYYLRYSDVKKSKINPLIHYSLYGIQEGRTTHKKQKKPQLSITKKKKLNDKYCASIILTTSNQTKYLGKSIDSVLDQTFSDYELIIVDYGNTDKTKKFIKNNYRHQLKKGKIKYIHKKGSNNNAARNKGLKKARGKVIAYINANSNWSNNYLEKMVSSLAENNSNTAYASIELNDDEKNQIIKNTEYDRKTILESNFIDINAFVHKRFLYHQLGDFDDSLNELADWDFVLRYTRLNKPYFLNEILVKQFLNKSSQDISKNKLKKEQLKIKKLHSAELIQNGLDHLRLGYVLWDFPALSQTFVMNELRWLVENNYDVKVFYKEKPDKEAELDFDIESIQFEDVSDLVEKIKEFNINMMHTHFAYPAGKLLTYPAAKKAKIPFTLSAHAVDIFREKSEAQNKIAEISKCEYCKRIFIPGQFHYDYLSKRGVAEEKLMLVRQATNYEIDEEIDTEMPIFKRDIKNIITIARFVEKKGLDTLIDAAKILKDADLKFTIYGYGPLEKELRKRIADLNLTNIVIGNAIESKDDLIKTYKNGDIFVLPCKRAFDGDMDGIPTVIFEAMAYGIPVITTNVSCIPEFVINDYCGFTVDSNDPIALANKIRHVKNMDKNQLFTILKRAQTQVQKNSSVDETIETMLDIWLNKRIDLFMVTHQKNQYKDIKSLKEILDRIFKYTNTEFDLTIVDNDSDIDFKNFIIDYIESKPNVRLILLKSNLLCGPASNIALESMENEFALYICSNEGFILKPGWERKALNYMRKQKDVAIAGTLAYAPHYYNGKTYKDNAFFENFRNKEFMNGKKNLKFHHVQGGAYILRKEAYSQCGGFNPLLPQDHMDVEYSYYLESMDWKLGEISNWISITKKTHPRIYAYLDEYTTLVHPSNLKDLKTINSQAVNNCNICKGKIIRDICDSCGSDSSERTIYRIVSGSNKIHRSKKCTLLLKHNSNLKQYEKLFEINNKKYSTSNITEKLEEILKNIEQTDVLITNTDFKEQNYKEMLTMIIEKLTENGLLIIQMSHGNILNNKIKEFLKDNGFKIKIIEFASNKLNNDEFLVAEW